MAVEVLLSLFHPLVSGSDFFSVWHSGNSLCPCSRDGIVLSVRLIGSSELPSLLGLGLRGSSAVQGEDLCSSLTIPWLYVAKAAPESEPLIPSELPELPWQKVDQSLWMKNDNYLLIVENYSRFIQVVKLNRTTATEVRSQDKNNLHKTRYPWSCFLWQRTSILSGGIREVLPRLPIWAQDQQSLLSSSKWRSGESRTYSQGIVREEQRSSPCTAELPRNPNPRRKV